MHPPLFYQIALTLLPGIGPVKAKNLITWCGSAEQVFREKKQNLQRIPEIGEFSASLVNSKEAFGRAERELRFMEDNHVHALFYQDEKFPERLRQCSDSPVIIYTKGKMDLNALRMVAVVGTRTATSYGKEFCSFLLQGIQKYKPSIISGLAYGIDICAHRNALANRLQTVACVAHGLERFYPALHTSVAIEMMNNGGLISEFPSNTRMTPELFPMRNRLIAGLCDCTIVVETDEKGGSMITAYLASSYGREVFALAGRYNDRHSSGCHLLVKKNIAALLTGPDDLIEYMNWDQPEASAHVQAKLFPELSKEEQTIVDLVKKSGRCDIDTLSIETGMSFKELSSKMLQLEFQGIVKSLPGKQYEII